MTPAELVPWHAYAEPGDTGALVFVEPVEDGYSRFLVRRHDVTGFAELGPRYVATLRPVPSPAWAPQIGAPS